jgi:hypothetical protein
MAVFIHREPQLYKCLNKMRRAGGRAALAAERIEEIIAALSSNANIQPQQVNKMTRHGEARIENCKKFDLVGGYRLVYVKEDEHYFFLFAGTHDDCHHWLNNNRNLKPEINGAAMPLMVHQADEGTLASDYNTTECSMDYDEILMQSIDEKMLRLVFRGLCGDL